MAQQKTMTVIAEDIASIIDVMSDSYGQVPRLL